LPEVKAIVALDPYFLTCSEKLSKSQSLKTDKPIALINAERFHFVKTEYMQFNSL